MDKKIIEEELKSLDQEVIRLIQDFTNETIQRGDKVKLAFQAIQEKKARFEKALVEGDKLNNDQC